MVAVAVVPLASAVLASEDSWTVKLPWPTKLFAGVNLRPAAAWAAVIIEPLMMGVVPLFWNSVPLVIPVIR